MIWDEIADYTLSRWGERQVEIYLSKLAKRFAWRSKNPNVGRIRDDIGKDYRSYRQGSHLIFYTVEDGVVAIIGAPHGSMDIEAFFDFPE